MANGSRYEEERTPNSRRVGSGEAKERKGADPGPSLPGETRTLNLINALNNEPTTDFGNDTRGADFIKTLPRLSGLESITAAPLQENQNMMSTYTLQRPLDPHLEQQSV